MGQKLYLTEEDLTKVIEESVREVLNENEQNEIGLLTLGALAGAGYLYGRAKQRGKTPLKNAYNRIRSAINGTEYKRQVNQPEEYSKIDDIREFQQENFAKYANEANIVVGVWGPYEQQIYDTIQRSKKQFVKPETTAKQSTPKFQVKQGGGGIATAAEA